MKTILIIQLTLLFALKVFATEQCPDTIIYNGKKYTLHSHPLYAYFENNPDKKPKVNIISSGLWRGYVATFEVKDNQLFLKDIEIMGPERDWKWQSVINEVFPDQKEIKVNWFTGLLVIPHGGKVANYFEWDYGSSNKKYLLVKIDKGDLKKEKDFKYKKYEELKKRHFQDF
jgi:hypothetical protein